MRRIVPGAFAVGLVLRLVLALRPLAALDRQFIPDDTYYTLGIARSLGHGHGPSLDGIRTSGFQPLLAFLLSPVAAVTSRDGLLRCALVLLAVCDALCILLIARLASRLGGPVAGAVAAALWAVSPIATGVALGGLETALALLVSLVLVELWCQQRWWWVGVFSGLAVLARLDLILLVAVLGIVEVARGGWRSMRVAAPTGALVLAPWWGWCWWRLGSPLPESGSAVHQEVLLHRSLNLTWSRPLGWAAGEVLGGPVVDEKSLRTWTYFHFVSSLLLFVAVVLVILAGTWWASRQASWPVAALGLHAVGLLLFYGTYLSAPWFFRRYLHAAVLVATLLVAVVLARALRSPGRWVAGGLVAAGLVTGLVGVLRQVVRDPSTSVDVQYDGAKGYREMAFRVLAQVPAGAVLGSLQSGALSYYAPSSVRVVNLDGVVNHAAAEAVREKDLGAYARAARVTVFADWQFNADNFALRFTTPAADRPTLTRFGTPVPHAGDEILLWHLTWPA